MCVVYECVCGVWRGVYVCEVHVWKFRKLVTPLFFRNLGMYKAGAHHQKLVFRRCLPVSDPHNLLPLCILLGIHINSSSGYTESYLPSILCYAWLHHYPPKILQVAIEWEQLLGPRNCSQNHSQKALPNP